MSTEENQAQQRAHELARAYAVVFGTEEKRTEAQRIVWADMEHRGYIHRSTMVPDGDGKQCEHRMTSAEGQRIFVLNTKNLIQRGDELGVTKPKPKVKKSP